MMYRTILFDLDGTLTDSKEGIVNCARHAIEALGDVPPEERVLAQFVGPPLRESFASFCGYGPEKVQEAVRLFRERYTALGQFENRAAPGMAELLARLRQRGYVLAVASSKREDLCVSICQRFGFAPSLSAIVGSAMSDNWSKADVVREALARLCLSADDASSILMVGDRKYDVIGARAFGIDCLGVDFFGYAPPGELEEAGAVAVADSAAAVEDFILGR